MKMITEKTAIPISLFVVLTGGIAWLTTVYARVESNTQDLAKLQSKVDILGEIDRRLAVIETELRLIRKQYEEER